MQPPTISLPAAVLPSGRHGGLCYQGDLSFQVIIQTQVEWSPTKFQRHFAEAESEHAAAWSMNQMNQCMQKIKKVYSHVMYTPLYHICFTLGLLWHKERRYLLFPQKNQDLTLKNYENQINKRQKNNKKLLRRPSSCVPDIFLISEPLTEAWIIAKFSSFLAPPDSVTPQGRLRYWWVSSGQLPKYVGQAFEARSWRWIQKCWDFSHSLCQLRQGLEENSNFIWNKMSFCFSKSSEPHEWVPKWRMCIVCSSCQTDTKQCSDKRMEKAMSIQPLYRNLKCWKWKIRTTVQVSSSKYLQKLPSGIAEDILQDIPAWYIAAPDFT